MCLKTKMERIVIQSFLSTKDDKKSQGDPNVFKEQNERMPLFLSKLFGRKKSQL